ncbi:MULTISPECIES: hypothetical protein [unclassified Streptomyces]|uniref:hypothetical protein n=1 Tax=Streptomyces sp. NPDC055082 TaxID=3365718 RepID=UPI0037D57BDB
MTTEMDAPIAARDVVTATHCLVFGRALRFTRSAPRRELVADTFLPAAEAPEQHARPAEVTFRVLCEA